MGLWGSEGIRKVSRPRGLRGWRRRSGSWVEEVDILPGALDSEAQLFFWGCERCMTGYVGGGT